MYIYIISVLTMNLESLLRDVVVAQMSWFLAQQIRVTVRVTWLAVRGQGVFSFSPALRVRINPD